MSLPFPPESPLINIANGDLATVRQHVVRRAQITRAMLMMGVVIFVGVAVVTAMGKPPKEPVMALIAAGFAVLATVARAIVVPLVIATQRRKIARAMQLPATEHEGAADANEVIEKQLYMVWQINKLILEAAILEGAAFFNLVAYIEERQWWSLAVAGSLLASMAASFPTRRRGEDWIRIQSELIELDRTAGTAGRE